MLLDAISIYLIMMPILIPVMQHFEWNPVWFGIYHGSCQDTPRAYDWLGAAVCGCHGGRFGTGGDISQHCSLAAHGVGL